MQVGVTMRFALEYLLEGLVCVLLSLSIHYSAGELALAIFLALGILAALVLFCYRCTQRTLKKSNYESAKGDKQDLISQVCCWRTRSVKLSKDLEYVISKKESKYPVELGFVTKRRAKVEYFEEYNDKESAGDEYNSEYYLEEEYYSEGSGEGEYFSEECDEGLETSEAVAG